MPEESHYFEWNVGLYGRPYTTDPRHAATLDCGPHNCVTIDGEDAGMVLRCQTGPDGWVETPDVNADGTFRQNEDGTLATVTRRGRVEFSIVGV